MIKHVHLAFVCLVPLAFMAFGAQAKQIGTAREARNQVTGIIDSVQRRIRRGDGVSLNELIKTGTLARAELKFLDDTMLTIGAKSTVRLDAFVFNPGRNSGKIVLNTLKGAFRFVSGTAPKSAYQIKTPLATIGVRGTVIDGYLDRAGKLAVFILQKGGMEVCSSSMCQNVDTPRQYVVVRDNGQITPPKTWRGPPRKIRFQTTFPVGRGKYYIDPRNFDMDDGGSIAGDSDSDSSGSSNSYGGAGSFVSD